MAEKKEKKASEKAPKAPKAPKTVKIAKASKKEKVVEEPVITPEVTTKSTADSKTTEWISGASKQDLINEFATKNGDTGSPEVQVALATHKILNLTLHLEQNPKDNHSRRGLLKVISKRRRILNYLNEKDTDRYKALIKKVQLTK